MFKCECLCKASFYLCHFVRLYGYFPYTWKSHKSEEDCQYHLSKPWLIYSLLFCFFEAYYRYSTIIISIVEFSDYFDYINKYICVLLNTLVFAISLTVIKLELLAMKNTTKFYSQLCLPSKKKTTNIVYHILLFHLVITFGGFYFLKKTKYEHVIGLYSEGSLLNYITVYRYFGKTYLLFYWAVIHLARNYCLKTITISAIKYQPNHPIAGIEIKNEGGVNHFLGIIRLTSCNKKEDSHLRFIPMAIVSLNHDNVLEFLRMKYKETNTAFMVLSDLLRQLVGIMVFLEVPPVILDAFYIIRKLFFSDYTENSIIDLLLLCHDRILVMILKLIFVCVGFYSCFIIGEQVRPLGLIGFG